MEMNQEDAEAAQRMIEFVLTYRQLGNHKTGPPIIKVGGHWFPAFMGAYWPKIFDLNVRDDDVMINGFPISGTNYLKYIVEQIMIVIRPGFKPRRPQGVLENVLTWGGTAEVLDKLASEPSPRVLWTHLPVNLLPHDVFETKAKLIYCRCDPKDNAASMYKHYITATTALTNFNDTFAQFLDRFISGEVVGGPYPEHINAFLELQKQSKDKLLFVDTPDLEMNRKDVVKRIGAFLGDPDNLLTEAEIDRIVKETSYEWLLEKGDAAVKEHAMKGSWKLKDEAFWDHGQTTGKWKELFNSDETLISRFEAAITAKIEK